MEEREKLEQEKMDYLQSVVDEALADDTWELPKEARFFLMPGFELEVLYL